jgi:hypothetical protein
LQAHHSQALEQRHVEEITEIIAETRRMIEWLGLLQRETEQDIEPQTQVRVPQPTNNEMSSANRTSTARCSDTENISRSDSRKSYWEREQ